MSPGGRGKIIRETADFVKKKFEHDQGGHDWYHMERVWKMARHLGEVEGTNLFIVEMAALLHDYADWKLVDDQHQAKKEMLEWLENQGVSEAEIKHISTITENVSFKGVTHKADQATPEGRVVQDADRLDAIGAIAIARVFAFGGARNRPIYNPLDELERKISDEEYQRGNRSGIHHFYDKLLRLKDLINTQAGKKIAQDRHEFMEKYLEQFFAEWKGER